MNIRIMTIDDYEKVYDLWVNTVNMGLRSLDDSLNGIQKFLQRNPATNFVAVNDNEIIGVILCGHDGRRGFIYHTAVKLEYRNQGIGKKLVDCALKSLRKENINKVALVVFHSNELGNAFWESIGFKKRDDLIYRNLSINDENI